MSSQRQVVKYTFWKIDPQVLAWPAVRRAEAAAELADLLEGAAQAGTLLTYSTVGLRGDCDLLVWQAADRVDQIQLAASRWRDTGLGPHLQVAHSFLAMLKPSPYLGGHRHPEQEGRRRKLKPRGAAYLFVYPMWKKRSWYRLPYERRKAMMIEHFAVGHRYPQVKINTAYAFGLDDPEFVVAFESDDPAAFNDLVTELRESQASRYTERETPIFTCVRMAPRAALDLALGLRREVSPGRLAAPVSLLTGA
jgi:chlorite dismutase